MSLKYSSTTADYLSWTEAITLVRRLYDAGDYMMSLLVGCGIFFGLRISDLRSLRWAQILNHDELTVVEQKTGKRRVIRINKGYQRHIKDCHAALEIKDDSQPCFLNKNGRILSVQMINRKLKAIKFNYHLRIGNFSTHSLRKTWARQIWENENAAGRGEAALVKLSELMAHSSPSITRRYIGLRAQELGEVYDSLKF